MQRLRTVTSLDVSAVAGHHAMPAALLLIYILHLSQWCDLSFTPVDGDGIDNDCDDLIDEEDCSPENMGVGKN